MILITGCNSLLGRTLTKALLKRGEKIKGLDFFKEKDFPDEAEFIEGNLLDVDLLKKACEGVETVFHFMEIKKYSYGYNKFFRRINIKGTKNILEAAKSLKVKKFFFLSSFAIYGASKQNPILSDSRKKPITSYGKQKRQAENICWKYLVEKGMEITIFRPALIAGPNVKNQIILSMLYMALALGDENRLYLAGNGKSKFQLLHPEDATTAFLAAYDSRKAKGQVYNLGSDNVLSQKEQVDKLKELTNFKGRIKYTPFYKIRLLSFFAKIFKMSFFSEDHVFYLLNDMILDCQKAKEDLNWQPKKDNIQIMLETIEWYKKEKI